MKSFYLILLASVISFTACRTKEGEPGPAGESSLNKQGSVTGTITYTDNNGDDASTSFNYQYYESLNDNKFYFEDGTNLYYDLNFERRDLKDSRNYFDIEVSGYGMNGVLDDPTNAYLGFSYFTVINNELYAFYGSENVDITNVSLDETTGRLIFDFTGDASLDGNSGTVTGRVDVILNRSRTSFGD